MNRNVLVEVIVRVVYATVGLKVGEVPLVMSKVVLDGDLIVLDMARVSPPWVLAIVDLVGLVEAVRYQTALEVEIVVGMGYVMESLMILLSVHRVILDTWEKPVISAALTAQS